MPRQIIRTGIGEVEDVTLVVPSDAQTIQCALGSSQFPTAWIAPTRVDSDDDGTQTVVLTVGPSPHFNPAAGRYWFWVRYLDGSGQVLTPRSRDSLEVVTDTGNPLVPAVDVASKSDVAGEAALRAAGDVSVAAAAASDASSKASAAQSAAVAAAATDASSKASAAQSAAIAAAATDASSKAAAAQAAAISGAPVQSVAGRQGAVTLTKGDVGLGNVANVAPADLPVSTAQQAALDTKASTSQLSDYVPRSGYGVVVAASGDTTGATDAATLAACLASGVTVHLVPGATYTLNAPITIYDRTRIEGHYATLKLANGANCDVIRSANFSALTGTGSGGGVNGAVIRQLFIDGNRTNQTGTSFGIRFYGYRPTFEDVVIRSCYSDGLYTEWGAAAAGTPSPDSMEGCFRRVTIHDCGAWGWHMRGPHDSTADHVIIYLNNQNGGNNGGLWVENDNVNNPQNFLAGALQLVNCHIWGSSHAWALIAEGSTMLDNSQIEGGAVGQILVLAPLIMRGGKVFNLVNNNQMENIGIQLGDDGNTAGYANTRSWTVGNVNIDTEMQGFYGASPASAPVSWKSCNNSTVEITARMVTAPIFQAISSGVGTALSALTSLTVANATSFPRSGRVQVPTSAGSAVLAYTSISGNTLNGLSIVTGSGTDTLSAGNAAVYPQLIWGTVDPQSIVRVQGTNTSATPQQKAAWDYRSQRGTTTFYGGSGGAIPTVKIDADVGHLDFSSSGSGTVPTFTPHANLGTGGTATSSGSGDTAGQLTITPGSGTPVAGTAATVNLSKAFTGRNPVVIVSSASSATAALDPYATATGKGTVIIGFRNAPAASTAYYVNYWIVG